MRTYELFHSFLFVQTSMLLLWIPWEVVGVLLPNAAPPMVALSTRGLLPDPAPPTVALSTQGLLTVEGGAPLSLLCTAGGSPTPTVTWDKDGQAVTSSDSDGISVSEGNLTIGHMTGYDVGEYSCRATNALGEASSAKVRVKVTGLHFQDHLPPEVSTAEGQSLTLPCQASIPDDVTNDSQTASNQPQTRVAVHWYFEGSEITREDNQFERLPDGLTFVKVIMADSGRYKCVAQSANFSIAMETRLIVQVLPLRVHLALHLSSRWLPELTLSWIPSETSSTTPVTVRSYSIVLTAMHRHKQKQILKSITVSADMSSVALTGLTPGQHYEIRAWANSAGGQGPVTALHFVTPWSHTVKTYQGNCSTFLDVENPQFWLAFSTGVLVMMAVFVILSSLWCCIKSQWPHQRSFSAQDAAAGGSRVPSTSSNQSWGFVNPSFDEESASRGNMDKVSLNNLELIWTNQTRF